jgi:MFS family permease
MTPAAEGASPAPVYERTYRIKQEGKNVGWFQCAVMATGAVVAPIMMYFVAGQDGFCSSVFLMGLGICGLFLFVALMSYPLMEGYIRMEPGVIVFRSEQIIPRYWFIRKHFSLMSKLYVTHDRRYELLTFMQGKQYGQLDLNGLPAHQLKELLYLLGENENVELTLDESHGPDRLVHIYKKGEFERTQ